MTAARKEVIQANNTSGYRGVTWDKEKKRWKAQLMVEGKSMNLGKFKCKHEAARAYNSAAKQYLGEDALLNTIDESQ